ncbi:MAG TPA: ATP-binding protein [Polyangiaceae bacterium]|nr:ATP-binding protein [Polyangiaceae bacterium]
MATVHLLCGKVGSGKTTYARRLESNGAVRFSVDEWMLRLYGPHMPRKEFDARLSLCLDIIMGLSERLAMLGVPAVVDAGFWRREQRDEARARLERAGVSHCLHFFDVPDDELWRRLELRNRERTSGTFEITREMFELFRGWFEPPGPDEVVHQIDFSRSSGSWPGPPTERK